MVALQERSNRIGLALGSGSSRGWSHIGVIRALGELGVEPEIVCGCSIGALVGAAYAEGRLDELERWVSSLSKFDVARFFELNLSFNGFVDTDRLAAYLKRYVFRKDDRIESLGKTFAAVATDLETGREVWMTKGPVMDAVWASIAVPGLFPPVYRDDRWLVDGGLVNPVPVSLCRAFGADIVIAVNLNGDIIGKHLQRKPQTVKENDFVAKVKKTFKKYSPAFLQNTKSSSPPPTLIDSITASLNILQDRITRSRMAGDPPDLILAPKLSHIGLLEFHRANEAISAGKECVLRAEPEVQRLFGNHKIESPIQSWA